MKAFKTHLELRSSSLNKNRVSTTQTGSTKNTKNLAGWNEFDDHYEIYFDTIKTTKNKNKLHDSLSYVFIIKIRNIRKKSMENLRISEKELQTGYDLEKAAALRQRDEKFVEKLNYWEADHSLGSNFIFKVKI